MLDVVANPDDNPDELAGQALLGLALLKAASVMLDSQEEGHVFHLLCESLVNASPRIRLAWVGVQPEDATQLSPQYSAGPAKCFVKVLLATRSDEVHDCPAYRALVTNQIYLGPPESSVPRVVRQSAQERQIAELLCLPFSLGPGKGRGVLSIGAEQRGYFDALGRDIFEAFAQLGQAMLTRIAAGNGGEKARMDVLTGMLNRSSIQHLAKQELVRAWQGRAEMSLLLFNIDRFKLINDRFGTQQGDFVLQRVTRAARSVLRGTDIMGRWSGGDILCVLPETGREEAAMLAERVRQAVASTDLGLHSDQVHVSVSIGTATSPRDGDELHDLLTALDAALYEAKSAGRNRVVEAASLRQRVFHMGATLDSALRDQRIMVAYQPIVDLATGLPVAEEALARLVDVQGHVMAAAEFIDAATRLQLVHKIDHAVIMSAMGRCLRQVKNGSRLNHFFNLSGDLMRHPDLVFELLEEAKQGCQLCGDIFDHDKPLVIEVTERELFGDIESTRALLDPFLDFGFRLALDDFGSGYSSFQYLAELPFTYLKIEGSLVRRVREPKVRAILQGIQNTADDLGLITLAEFVEDEETAARLRQIGVNWGQGYYFGCPVLEQAPDRTP